MSTVAYSGGLWSRVLWGRVESSGEVCSDLLVKGYNESWVYF